MLPITALGAAAGLGLWMVVAGLVRAPQPLPELAAHISRERTDARPAATGWERMALGLVGERWSLRRSSDLAVTEQTPSGHAVACLQSAVLLSGTAVGCWLLARVAGFGMPLVGVGLGLVAAGPLGWFAADRSLKTKAARARRDFQYALATYLDLVVALLVGGAGIDTALDDAARLGSGPAFRMLRSALSTAQEHREAPWRALGELGDRLTVPGLAELAASMTLAGEQGARVRESLIAKAASLRGRELAEAEAEAARASEAMTMPVVARGFGFVLLVCYPPLIHLAHL